MRHEKEDRYDYPYDLDQSQVTDLGHSRTDAVHPGIPLNCVSSLKQFRANENVYFEGDAVKHLFEVSEGVLKLYKLTRDGRRQITGFRYPGQMLGLQVQDGYVHTAETITEAKLIRYSRSDLERLTKEVLGLAQWLLGLATLELVAAQNQMLLLGRKTASERLASFFWRLLEESENGDDDERTVFLPMARADIADYLGLTSETVSRMLSRFKVEGIIQLRRNGYVKIRDVDRLRELAEGVTGATPGTDAPPAQARAPQGIYRTGANGCVPESPDPRSFPYRSAKRRHEGDRSSTTPDGGPYRQD